MAVSSPQDVWTQPTVATNQRIVKPNNQSANPASTGQDTTPRLNARLGIIGMVNRAPSQRMSLPGTEGRSLADCRLDERFFAQ